MRLSNWVVIKRSQASCIPSRVSQRREINALRNETGSVWQAEYYDRGVRGEESLNEIIRYCYENPVRKGLVKWARDYPYWWCKFKVE